MQEGGDGEEVSRWLRNFATAHARREVLSAEAAVEQAGPPATGRYRVRVRVGGRAAPSASDAGLEVGIAEVAQGRGRLAWCADLAARIRALARAAAERGAARSA